MPKSGDWRATPLPPTRYLTQDELAKFLKTAEAESRKYALMFNLISYLALRVAECAALRLDAFSDPPNFVTIQGLKNGLKRPYPFPEPYQKMLKHWLADRKKLQGADKNPYLFPHRDFHETGHMIPEGIQFAFYAIAKKAGLKGHSVHDLRHTTAQELVRNKEGLAQVASWLRHREIDSSKRYVDHAVDLELDQRQAERALERFKKG
ncbi:MAG: site-specific integrase [Acidobacteriota bacterium]